MRSILFCNEMLGLGHLSLSLTLAAELAAAGDRSTALVVSGSPAVGLLPAPAGVDVLKLPCPPVAADSRWQATDRIPKARLTIDDREIRELRAALCVTAVASLAPDIAVVDYRPLGRDGELLAALQWLRGRSDCTVALGLWEVDDSPVRLGSFWTAELGETLAGLYDVALVYGESEPGDVRLQCLRAAGVPIRHTELIAQAPAEQGPEDLPPGYLLALAGGGIDGFQLLDAILAVIAVEPLSAPVVLVTGPMMPAAESGRLRRRAAGVDALVVEHRPDMSSVLAGARSVVAMAGYCTAAEVLASGKPALLVPRNHPREEQLNRARRLEAAGLVELTLPTELEPRLLRPRLERLLARPASKPRAFTGARQAATILRGLALDRGAVAVP